MKIVPLCQICSTEGDVILASPGQRVELPAGWRHVPVTKDRNGKWRFAAGMPFQINICPKCKVPGEPCLN